MAHVALMSIMPKGKALGNTLTLATNVITTVPMLQLHVAACQPKNMHDHTCT